MGPGPDIRKMVSHERKWGRFLLTHGQRISGREREREEFTENDHQKIPPGVVAAKRLGLWYAFGTVYVPACCTEVFLLGAATLGVSSLFRDPLILSRESSSGRRPNGL